MKQFGESTLYRFSSSFLQRIRFFFEGHDFIGAEIRLAHFKKALKKISPPFHSVLDAGCGTGDFSFFVAERYSNSSLCACDINKNTLQKNTEIQQQMGINNIIFSYKNLLTLDEKETYDFIFSIGTIIYFSKHDTKNILQRLTTALQSNGYLYIDLPQENFLEVNWLPTAWYPTFYTALEQENSGDLYTFEEMQGLLQEMGYTILLTNKSFSFAGKFAWELDNLLRERKSQKVRYILLLFLKFLARIDAITKHKKGCCFVILARKR